MGSKLDVLPDVFDAGGRGLQHHGLRRSNERAVLTIIGFNPGVSNAEISRLSGLAPQTVSAILVDIERAGMVMRGEALRGRRGQPATPIYLDPQGAFAIGCEIGWRHADVLLLNMHADVLGHQRIDYAYPDATSVFDAVTAAAQSLIATLPVDRRCRVADLGVSLPINIGSGWSTIAAPPHQAALWQSIDAVAELAQRTGLEVNRFNDGNAACWAELIAFPRPRPGSFIYLLISRYVAAGIVGEGRLWEGPTGNSANLGSMVVSSATGQPQAAHLIASVNALEQHLAEAGIQVGSGPVDQWDWQSFGAPLESWIAASAKALAQIVFNTSMVIESQSVVIDAILPRPVVELLVERLARELAMLPSDAAAPPDVLVGHLGALAPAIGAAELPLYRRFLSRTIDDLAN